MPPKRKQQPKALVREMIRSVRSSFVVPSDAHHHVSLQKCRQTESSSLEHLEGKGTDLYTAPVLPCVSKVWILL